MQDGRIYEGQWKDGFKEGYGKYCGKDGEWKEGIW